MDFGFLSAIRLTELLPWVLPPLLGAVIGYVTNAIAIRMLFRPLTKVRVLGVPLPLTPGIIPRQRGQLAESIGQMVSRELLTEEAVRLQLASAGFQVRVEQNIHSLLGQLISTPLERLRGRNHDLVFASVEGFLSESLYSFFSSRSFIHGVRTIISRLLRSLGGRTVEELIGDTDVGALVMRKAIPALSEPENRGRIAAALEGWLERQRQGERLLDSV
ncbi:MAG: DUF445 family protein, partial [Spirochaetales bacterium]|nr:DUF445 family protein [Spirochaetales bacterium]